MLLSVSIINDNSMVKRYVR